MSRIVWTVRDKLGFPAPINADGKRSQPFWSSKSRVERIIKNVAAYAGFEPYEISWEDFCSTWVPELTSAECLVGVNWSGKLAVCYDIEPERLARSVQTLIDEPQ